jgi:hypothetical protein
MELLSLAAATGNVSYARTAETIVRNLNARHPGEGLLPIYVSLADAAAAGPVTVGAMADSYYEYLLKSFLLTGEGEWLAAFVEAYTSAMRHCSPPIVLMLEREGGEVEDEASEEEDEGGVEPVSMPVTRHPYSTTPPLSSTPSANSSASTPVPPTG